LSGLDIELQSQKIDENQVNLANFRQRSNEKRKVRVIAPLMLSEATLESSCAATGRTREEDLHEIKSKFFDRRNDDLIFIPTVALRMD